MNHFRAKILVIRGGAIGDFILTLPVLAALRQQFPEARLEILGYTHITQLALAGGLVDRVEPIEARALAGFFARHGPLAEDLADFFSEFDLIVSYLYDPDRIFQANVCRCTSAQFIAGPHRPDENGALHAAKVYLKPLERLAIFDADPVPRLSVRQESRAPESSAGSDPSTAEVTQGKPGPEPRPALALHPGSGSERKNWPEANWAELLEQLASSSAYDLLLVGGEAEGQRLQNLAAALPPARTRVAQSLPLAELARRLNRCAAFIGHDSGISHMAGALGMPGLLLWGDTPENIWRPPSEKMVLLRHPAGLAMLPVSQVVAALARMGLCAFC